MKIMDGFFDKIFHCLTAISFGLVSACTLVQIVARYTPGFSAPWTDELTRLFFMYTNMFGSPMAIKYAEYAVIDVVTGRIQGTPSRILHILIHALIAVFCGTGAKQALVLFQTGTRTVSASLRISMTVFYLVPVGIFVLTLVYCVAGMIQELLTIGRGKK